VKTGTAGESQWPPRSPLAALKSTPGGRDRLRRLAERRSPSPSPITRNTTTPSRGDLQAANIPLPDDVDDEDEEMLQLQLQEIQARLKLKKLQKAKAQNSQTMESDPISERRRTAPPPRASSAIASRGHRDIAGLREQRLERSKSQASLHVPVSPVRKIQSVEPQRSPGRVLLGIDKGLKAGDVSLKRAPSLRRPQSEQMDAVKRAGSYLQRVGSQLSSHESLGSNLSQPSTQPKPLTFSERMAKVRNEEVERREREARIQKARSKAFNIDQKEMEEMKSVAATMPDMPTKEPEFSREQVLSAVGKPVGGLLQRSKSTTYLSSATRNISNSTASTLTSGSDSRPASRIRTKPLQTSQSSPLSSQSDTPEFESFSSLHLTKRIIPHNVLTRTLAGKKTFLIPDLLKSVTAPFFQLPDIEEDIVVLAIVAAKSEPKSHKAQAAGQKERGKFMVLNLCDLKWDLDLFLFDTGFEKYWKLIPGTVVAILNPTIMKPTRADTGKFSLIINNSDDTILEIGSARDLGYCKSVKKDGKACAAWIDKRHTEFCEFHVNQTLAKTKAGRMEVNTMNFGYKKGYIKAMQQGMYGGRKNNSRDMTHAKTPAEKLQDKADKASGKEYSFESRSSIYVHGGGRSTADMFDEADLASAPFARGRNQDERLRERLAEQEKERNIVENLAKVGGGLGADYMRHRSGARPEPVVNSGQMEAPPLPDARALGLVGGRAKDMHLSPVKRKRATTNSTIGSGMSGSSAVGWGGNLTKELGRMKEGERLQPVKKKTRFVTEKGIREAGRESFGGDVGKVPILDDNEDDDDDDLDIIM
jgi:minichromosome maintenance protein 10